MTDMMQAAVHVEFEFQVEVTGGSDALHRHGEQVMQHLLDLEKCNASITDASVGTDASDRLVNVSLLVFTDSEVEALTTALAVIRTAVHAAGGATPFWPDADRVANHLASYQPPRMQIERATAYVG